MAREHVSIELCGRLAVSVDGRPREDALPGRQGRLALGYLALHRGRPVTRDELVEALWGEEAGNAPHGGLAVVLSKLRRVLGPDAIDGAGRSALRLASEVRIDLEEVHALREDARAALAHGEPARARDLADGVLERTGRGLLVGLDAPWLEERRRELAELGLEAREVVAEAGLALGGPELAGAERCARHLVEEAPFRETGHALLMRVLEAQGNVAEALRVFDRLRGYLRDELGVPPSAKVQALVDRLLQAQPEPEAPAPAGPGATGSAGLPFFATRSRATFVGRHAELAALERHWTQALAGERLLVLLEGEPGVGKTRLALQFARDRGATVLYGRCDAETLVPYQPFVEALRGYATTRPPEELARWAQAHGRELGRVLPELDAPPGAGRDGSPAAETERYRLFEAVSALLVEVSRQKAVLLVLDDLHWADKPTLLMLRQVVRSTEGAPLLILGTYRDTERPEALLDALADLRREHFLERISVGGLAESDAAALIHQLSPRELSTRVNRSLWQETKGNPFFLEEMLRHAEAPSAVPEGVREVIGRRLARLSEAANRVLSTASALGLEFSLETLEQMDALGEDELDRALEEAVAAQVIVEVPTVFGRFSFSHALIRQTLYDDLTATRRARLHLRAAEALEALGGAEDGSHLAELAHHYFRAPPRQGLAKASEYAERAACRADAVLAYEEAARLYALAGEALTAQGGDEERRLRLLLARGEALVKAGEAEEARATYAAAFAAARDSVTLARAALGHGAPAQMSGGVFDEATVAMLEEALAELDPAEHALRARLLGRLAVELSFSESAQRRRALSSEAVESATAAGDPGALGYALIARHWALWGPENVQERLETTEDLLRLAQRAGDAKLASQGHRWRLIDLLELGDMEAVDAQLAPYAQVVETRRQLSVDSFYVKLFTAMRLLVSGRLAEAEPLVEEARRMGERVGDPNASGGHTLQLVTLRREQGRLAEVEAAVREHVEHHTAIPGWVCVLAHVLAEQGREEEARAELDRMAADGFRRLPLDGVWLGAMGYLAEAAAVLGDERHAAALYPLMLPYAQRNVAIGWGSTCGGSASRHLGQLADVLGRSADAEAHLTDAVAMDERMGAVPFALRSRLALARVLLGEGERERALALLDVVARDARPLGLVELAGEAEALSAATTPTPAPPAPVGS